LWWECEGCGGVQCIREATTRLSKRKIQICRVGNWSGPRALGAWPGRGLCPLRGRGYISGTVFFMYPHVFVAGPTNTILCSLSYVPMEREIRQDPDTRESEPEYSSELVLAIVARFRAHGSYPATEVVHPARYDREKAWIPISRRLLPPGAAFHETVPKLGATRKEMTHSWSRSTTLRTVVCRSKDGLGVYVKIDQLYNSFHCRRQ